MASQCTFRLDDELKARLEAEAKRQGRSVSNLIVWAITRELDPKSNWVPHKGFPAGSVGGTLPPPSVPGREPQWESPAVSAQRLADSAAKSEGTPLPKIARRKKR